MAEVDLQAAEQRPTPKRGDNLRQWWFKPGQSGNPGGRPSKRPVLDLIRDELRRLQPDLPDGEEERLIARAWIAMMTVHRSVPALKEWLDREYGPVVSHQQIEVGVLDQMRGEHARWLHTKQAVKESVAEVVETAPREVAIEQKEEGKA